jgi:predicted DsbA family dithiol-disulfide isomerase
MTDEALTMYSDYVCPFCYLGRRSLEAYQESREEELAVHWQPFDLRSHKRGPDGEIDQSVEDGKDDEYFERAKKNVERLQERYGAEEMLNLDDLPEDIDSLDAQVASWYVQEEYPEQWEAFDEAIFEALWIEGRDIGGVDVIVDIAEGVGLDGDEIREAIADEALRAHITDQFETAQDYGITGVPTFAYDEFMARGAVPPEQLARLVEGE